MFEGRDLRVALHVGLAGEDEDLQGFGMKRRYEREKEEGDGGFHGMLGAGQLEERVLKSASSTSVGVAVADSIAATP